MEGVIVMTALIDDTNSLEASRCLAILEGFARGASPFSSIAIRLIEHMGTFLDLHLIILGTF